MVPVQLPVLHLVDTPYQQIRCEWTTGSHEAAIQGADWIRQPASDSIVYLSREHSDSTVDELKIILSARSAARTFAAIR